MRILITGKSKLSRYLGDAFIARTGQPVLITHCRFEDEIDWDRHDIFINCAHVGFEQTNLLMKAFEAWKYNPSKKIINISSRAAQPNISLGYLYSAQKAALNHLANNLELLIKGKDPLPFEFQDNGEMISLGIGEASISGLGVTLSGKLAFEARRLIYASKLPDITESLKSASSWIFQKKSIFKKFLKKDYSN